ncbi:hypothetical protein AGLY_003095 [Aphis glycines]|uniref:Uncharacterized protein n=1 Tax=Aphis glycines TaxID=307491 RepID=A0A6G0U283_APHGL|nr:hypothetical protein AGLY_003095 [Aphis glycines]
MPMPSLRDYWICHLKNRYYRIREEVMRKQSPPGCWFQPGKKDIIVKNTFLYFSICLAISNFSNYLVLVGIVVTCNIYYYIVKNVKIKKILLNLISVRDLVILVFTARHCYARVYHANTDNLLILAKSNSYYDSTSRHLHKLIPHNFENLIQMYANCVSRLNVYIKYTYKHKSSVDYFMDFSIQIYRISKICITLTITPQ